MTCIEDGDLHSEKTSLARVSSRICLSNAEVDGCSCIYIYNKRKTLFTLEMLGYRICYQYMMLLLFLLPGGQMLSIQHGGSLELLRLVLLLFSRREPNAD